MTSGIAFDRPYRLSRLRAFPYDRFKIYTIVLIELNSTQAIEVVSVARVDICDISGSVSIWSYVNQALGMEMYLSHCNTTSWYL